MVEDSAITEAAERLWQAWETGQPCAPVADLIGEDMARAYQVQGANTARWLENGARVLSGRKVALSSRKLQQMFGVSTPVHGPLFADMELADGEIVAAGRLAAPRIEVEIGHVIGAPLDGPNISMVDLLGAISCALPAIEIISTRYGAQPTVSDLIADSASGGLYVVGQSPKPVAEVDHRMGGMVLFCNGEPVSYGAGVECMGSALNSTLWLARAMAAAGTPLGPGDFVLSGALGAPVPAAPGDRFEGHIAGLGSVRVGFDSA